MESPSTRAPASDIVNSLSEVKIPVVVGTDTYRVTVLRVEIVDEERMVERNEEVMKAVSDEGWYATLAGEPAILTIYGGDMGCW